MSHHHRDFQPFLSKGHPKNSGHEEHESHEEHGEHGHEGNEGEHGEHGEHEYKYGPHITVDRAKEINAIIINEVKRRRTSEFAALDKLNWSKILSAQEGESAIDQWFMDSKLKNRVIKCGKQLARYRYCEDNYGTGVRDPSLSITDYDNPCKEEEWQVAECLLSEEGITEKIATDAQINMFAQKADKRAAYSRKLSAAIQIPRIWATAVDTCDPNGITAPSSRDLTPEDPDNTVIPCLMRTIFLQEAWDLVACIERSQPENAKKEEEKNRLLEERGIRKASKITSEYGAAPEEFGGDRCSAEYNHLVSSWGALQKSRLDADNDFHASSLFTDRDQQKGKKLNRWKQVNIVGGRLEARNSQPHPGDYWLKEIQQKRRKTDWINDLSEESNDPSEESDDREQD